MNREGDFNYVMITAEKVVLCAGNRKRGTCNFFRLRVGSLLGIANFPNREQLYATIREFMAMEYPKISYTILDKRTIK